MISTYVEKGELTLKFVLIIQKDALYTYDEDGAKLTTRNIEGSEKYPLSVGRISADVREYMECLASEVNLGTIAKLEFEVLESEDVAVNTAVLSAIDGHVVKKYLLSDIISLVIDKLSRDKKLMIDKFGINYGNYSYKKKNGQVVKAEFDLLAYTMSCRELSGFIE